MSQLSCLNEKSAQLTFPFAEPDVNQTKSKQDGHFQKHFLHQCLEQMLQIQTSTKCFLLQLKGKASIQKGKLYHIQPTSLILNPLEPYAVCLKCERKMQHQEQTCQHKEGFSYFLSTSIPLYSHYNIAQQNYFERVIMVSTCLEAPPDVSSRISFQALNNCH